MSATRINVEVDDLTVEGVVDISHTHHHDHERFPDLPMQVGGCVLTSDGRIAYVRWVPGGKGRMPNTWDAATETLGYHVTERSHVFLKGPIESALASGAPPIHVLLLVGCHRYDAGTFDAVRYAPPVLSLARRGADGQRRTAPPSPSAPLPATTTTTTTYVRPIGVDSILEVQYHRLFEAWKVSAHVQHRFWGAFRTHTHKNDAAGYHPVMYCLEDADGTTTTVTWYTPDGHLYDILGDDVMAWCGDANRHGRNCVLEVKPVYPAQDVFAKLRLLAHRFSIAVLLVYGRPDIVPTEHRMQYGNLQYSQGTQGILFRPGDGRTSRVCFNAGDDEVVHVVMGECGEFGPPHPVVLAGHQSIGSGLLPRIDK